MGSDPLGRYYVCFTSLIARPGAAYKRVFELVGETEDIETPTSFEAIHPSHDREGVDKVTAMPPERQ